ncbi:MAG: selenocysteine-specific translation elongation factor [Acidobacteriaceae bacterium]|nr:selenocysteine-specific translation elongation factor [Acidobacteriaceae bacterium]
MNELHTNETGGIVVGTAGHIDHGKTSLVRALTGIDTDRLQEEKRRGISIDLGFAHLTLPDGRRISFIDVPGHERFVRNMLAGAGGMEAVLLVVAADESVKPQTREHFDICRLLGIQDGIIVLTKADLASSDQIAVTAEDVRKLCAGSFLENAPIIAVSAVTGAGLTELKQELSKVARGKLTRDTGGFARLPLDRSFSLKGFGTVVTGTLWSGALRAGQTVHIEPAKIEARIRGLQVHGSPVETAHAGQRTAVNLIGVEPAEIRRGFVLTHGEGLEVTHTVDASVEWLSESHIPLLREEFLFHIGTAEVKAGLKILERQAGSLRALARLRFDEPVLALPGDRFVLRRPSPPLTVAGGFVVDAFPPLRLNRARTVLRLHNLAHPDPGQRIQLLVEEQNPGRALPDLVRTTGRPASDLRAVIAANPSLVFVETAQRVVSKTWLEEQRKKLVTWLAVFHAKNPSAPGAPIGQARLGLDSALAHFVFEKFPPVRVQGDLIALAQHRAELSSEEALALQKIEQAFRKAGYTPPAAAEVLKNAGTDSKVARTLLESLIKNQKLVRVSEDLVFHADVIAHIRKSLSIHKGRRFSVPEFKEWTQISRKYAIPLLEYLDHQRVTRREGDARIVL